MHIIIFVGEMPPPDLLELLLLRSPLSPSRTILVASQIFDTKDFLEDQNSEEKAAALFEQQKEEVLAIYPLCETLITQAQERAIRCTTKVPRPYYRHHTHSQSCVLFKKPRTPHWRYRNKTP